jgi:hypothetical protein
MGIIQPITLNGKGLGIVLAPEMFTPLSQAEKSLLAYTLKPSDFTGNAWVDGGRICIIGGKEYTCFEITPKLLATGGIWFDVCNLLGQRHPHHGESAHGAWKPAHLMRGHRWSGELRNLLPPDGAMLMQDWALRNLTTCWTELIVNNKAPASMVFWGLIQSICCMIRYSSDPRLEPLCRFIADHVNVWQFVDTGVHNIMDPKWLKQIEFWSDATGVWIPPTLAEKQSGAITFVPKYTYLCDRRLEDVPVVFREHQAKYNATRKAR